MVFNLFCEFILPVQVRPPLLHAARQGHNATSMYLLEHGFNPAIASDLGVTALHHSAGIGIFVFCDFFQGTS